MIETPPAHPAAAKMTISNILDACEDAHLFWEDDRRNLVAMCLESQITEDPSHFFSAIRGIDRTSLPVGGLTVLGKLFALAESAWREHPQQHECVACGLLLFLHEALRALCQCGWRSRSRSKLVESSRFVPRIPVIGFHVVAENMSCGAVGALLLGSRRPLWCRSIFSPSRESLRHVSSPLLHFGW